MIQATIIVEPNPQGCYSFAIPINFGERGKVVTLQGGAPMTCMIYAAKSGTAVTFNFGGTTAGTIHPRGFGMRDIDLIGPHGNQFNCAGLGDTNTTGLLLGGTNGAEGFKFDGGRIACFNTDVRYSSYSWATEFRNFSLAASNRLLTIPPGVGQSGEDLAFVDGSFLEDLDLRKPAFGSTGFARTVVCNMGTGADISFINVSFDNVQLYNDGCNVSAYRAHFENAGAAGRAFDVPFVNNQSGSMSLYHPYMQQDQGELSITPSAWILNSGAFFMEAYDVNSGKPLSYLVQDGGNGSTELFGNLSSHNSFASYLNHTGKGTFLIDAQKGGGNFVSSTYSLRMPNLLFNNVAPTILSGFGKGASIVDANGPASFSVRVGAAPSSEGTVELPAAAHGWTCHAFDITSPTTGGGFYVKQTSGSPNTVTLTGYNTSGQASVWSANDIVQVSCFGF